MSDTYLPFTLSLSLTPVNARARLHNPDQWLDLVTQRREKERTGASFPSLACFSRKL